MRKGIQLFLTEEFQVVNGDGLRKTENHHRFTIVISAASKIHG